MTIEEHNDSHIHWSEQLYVNNSYLYLPLLEKLRDEGEREVEGLIRLFDSLKVKRGSKILDFSCGIGRHSIPLAKKGYEVVGYDPSTFFLNKAMVNSEQEKDLKIRFYNGKITDSQSILTSNNESKFDVIIIMFNSFGFMGENEDSRLLRDLLYLAKKDCVLVIETENRDWAFLTTMQNGEDHYIWERDGVLSNEVWKFNPFTSVMESQSKFYKKEDNTDYYRLQLELQIKLRLYSLHEMIHLLNISGWTFHTAYGSIKTLDNFELNSQYIVTVSKKII